MNDVDEANDIELGSKLRYRLYKRGSIKKSRNADELEEKHLPMSAAWGNTVQGKITK